MQNNVAECFPPSEAASKEELAERIKCYGNHFWLMFDGENGAWQMIFEVNTIPAYRRRGFAGELIKCAINDAQKQNRKGIVLTCKPELIAYYAKFGFVDLPAIIFARQSVRGKISVSP